MTSGRLVSILTISILILLLPAAFCEGARKQNGYIAPVSEVAAEILSLRRHEHGTYLEVQREDGTQEWIEIGREEGLEVKLGQRIAYTPYSKAYESQAFGRLRTGHDFRILPQQRGEDDIYRGSGPDNSIVFTDNPRPNTNIERATADGKPMNNRKKPAKKSVKEEEELVIDQEDLIQQKAQMDEYYRYLEQTSSERGVRTPKKAKKAMPMQPLNLP
jgi:hypothetical protein